MRYRQLGRSDLSVSEICLGSWLTYGDSVGFEQGRACVYRALDLGINFIDTANIYGFGAAESFLGEVLAGVPRSSYYLATKLYFAMSEADRGLSAAQIRKQIDASLRRLGTDYVDLYQCHRYDEDTPLAETMEALTEVVRQGKARYIGFSEWSPAQIRAALDLPGVERFVSSQPQYSMLWRAPEEEVFPFCQAEGIGQLAFSPLAQGVLTGKYRPGAALPRDSRATHEATSHWISDLLDHELLEAVAGLRPIAEQAGLTMAQLALAWVLREQAVTSAIVGASRPEQLDENVGASGVTLSADVLAAIDETLAPVVNRSY